MAPPPAPTSANTEVSQVAVSNEIDNSAWSALVKSGPPAYRILDDAAEKIAVADGLERRRDPVSGHNSLHASKAFAPGDIVHKIGAEEYLSSPNFLSVQVGQASHIILRPAYLQYVNHHCEPNLFYNTETFEIEALTHIAPGDALGFFYPSTEWDMESPFMCCCGSKLCVGNVKGAKHLSKEAVARYRFNKHIKEQLEAQNNN